MEHTVTLVLAGRLFELDIELKDSPDLDWTVLTVREFKEGTWHASSEDEAVAALGHDEVAYGFAVADRVDDLVSFEEDYDA